MRDSSKISNGVKKFILVIIVSIAPLLGIAELSAESSVGERVFLIEEKILLKNLPKNTSQLCLWIPYPVVDNWQVVEGFKLTVPFDYSIIIDKEYGNRIIYLKSKKQILNKSPVGIRLSFKAKRKEYNMSEAELTSPQRLKRFLKADRLVPVNGEIKKIAQEITQGTNDDLGKVKAIYNYIIEELTYAKDDPKVCGIGDSLLTLQYKKGICTDYHSLFISLVRSLGIPAKFEIGFRIPEDKSEGKLNGYHCWAKFYLKDKGWIPVDISEADKHPEKRDYFFGHIDENRLHLTSGRDISLLYARDKEALPLNFFIYPYVEVDGVEFFGLETEFSFKKL